MTSWSVAIYNHPTEQCLAIAQLADRLGLDTLWVGEHLFTPQHYDSSHPYRPHADPPVVAAANQFADMWVLMGAVLASTRRLRFATGVHVAPLRHPLLTARALTTAAELGPKRVILGLGAGWMQEEFDALGVPFEDRGSRLDESIALVRDALNGVTSFAGQHYAYDPLVVSENRVEIPIVIGGTSGRALRRAAAVADGWYGPTTVVLEGALRIRERLETLRREHGRGDEPFFYAVRINPHDPVTARAFAAEGFDQLVLEGEKIWPRDRAWTQAQKLAMLEQTIDDFGLRAELVTGSGP